jgi:hypothetical protein
VMPVHVRLDNDDSAGGALSQKRGCVLKNSPLAPSRANRGTERRVFETKSCSILRTELAVGPCSGLQLAFFNGLPALSEPRCPKTLDEPAPVRIAGVEDVTGTPYAPIKHTTNSFAAAAGHPPYEPRAR